MKTYEFKKISFSEPKRMYFDYPCYDEDDYEPPSIVEQLNELGAQGWSVVAACGPSDSFMSSTTFYLQRGVQGSPYRD